MGVSEGILFPFRRARPAPGRPASVAASLAARRGPAPASIEVRHVHAELVGLQEQERRMKSDLSRIHGVSACQAV